MTPRSIRLLLALWFLGGKDINQGKINDRLKVNGKKSLDCDDLYARLEQEEAIEVAKKKVSITNKGIELLGQGLQSSDLAIKGTIVGSWMAKALLKWIQQSDVSMNGAATNGKVAHSEITSQEKFKQVALEVYDRLNRDYNLDNLVPIYRIRREIGNQVSRSQFNEWMLDMQANDILQLIGGEMPGLTPDIAEDSIETNLGGVRYYVKKL
ncbi:MAG: hypothetical protein HC840_15875 [Leptolyngbyaceae cyanobacterium RM2_2_4]|nr:hypothetical protein [Leptolyngbyaceae cyanobacterium SM1_4_3]NJN90461.1 hypothetical protein [Leptolyngbyaceae cyanobacterium SL_5_14]NJO50673.1 hypothetical protein [Leptolyngbyaceae cyanobacterium RM2_2_4]